MNDIGQTLQHAAKEVAGTVHNTTVEVVSDALRAKQEAWRELNYDKGMIEIIFERGGARHGQLATVVAATMVGLAGAPNI